MSMSDLLAALTRDAEAEVDALRAAAEREAETLLATASRARSAQLDAEVERARQAHQRRADAVVATAALEARQARLTARADMLGRIHTVVYALLPALLERTEVVDQLIAAALEAAGDTAATLRCPASIELRVRQQAGNLPVIRDDGAGAGVRIELSGGRGEVDATLESFLDAVWPELRIAALGHVEAAS